MWRTKCAEVFVVGSSDPQNAGGRNGVSAEGWRNDCCSWVHDGENDLS